MNEFVFMIFVFLFLPQLCRGIVKELWNLTMHVKQLFKLKNLIQMLVILLVSITYWSPLDFLFIPALGQGQHESNYYLIQVSLNFEISVVFRVVRYKGGFNNMKALVY